MILDLRTSQKSQTSRRLPRSLVLVEAERGGVTRPRGPAAPTLAPTLLSLLPNPPLRPLLPELKTEPRGPAPRLGEHSEAVLSELGLSDNEIRRLRAEGVTN